VDSKKKKRSKKRKGNSNNSNYLKSQHYLGTYTGERGDKKR
jgi:hypothetical protein